MTRELSQAFEKAVELPECWDHGLDISTFAQIAALASEYAKKVEAGTATSNEITTLACHCKVLADDLFELATMKIREHDDHE